MLCPLLLPAWPSQFWLGSPQYGNIRRIKAGEDGDGEPLKDVTVFASDARYQFVVKVSSLWVSEKGSFGLSFDLQHLQIYQERCPFKA